MPKWTDPKDIARIKRVKAKQEAERVGQPFEIVSAPGRNIELRYCVALQNGSHYSVGGKPVTMTMKHARWYAARLNPDIKLSFRPVFGANSVIPTKKDVFNAGIIATEDVYVVAPGLEGTGHFTKIPKEHSTIVVNKAIDCPTNADIWMCCEPLCSTTEWFNNNIDANLDIACFWNHRLYEEFPNIRYTYEYGPPLYTSSTTGHECELLRGGLRDRCTISGQAIQLAYHLGAKRIILVGVDMMGDYYFDKTATGSEGHRPEGPWEWMLPIINPMIKWIQEQGVEVVSLSKTALDVEQI